MTSVEVRFRSLHPRKWSLKEASDEMLRELESVSVACVYKLKLTTATWSHKPTFRVMRRIYAGATSATARLEITTDDEIFLMVTRGVPPHSISPRSPVSSRNPSRPSALAARAAGSYRAKSTPRQLASRPGGPSGPVVYRPGVWHPGYPGRQFFETLQEWAQQELNRRIPIAIERGLASGIVQ